MRIWLTVFVICLLPALANSAELYKPAFRTLGIWVQEPEMRLDINLWYPASRAPRDLNFSPWIINAAPGGSPSPGKFPLVILSHASAGTRFSYHDTASWLASQGYIVAAPTHPHDSMNNMDDLFSWEQLTGRMEDILATINSVLKDRDIAKSVEKNRIGLLGFGAGGTACLFLGGSRPDCALWPKWCAQMDIGNPYCMPRVREKIDKMCRTFPAEKLVGGKALKAMIIVAPAYGMLFGPKSFNDMRLPVLIVAAGKDTVNKSELHSEYMARFLGSKAHYLDLANADTGAFMAPCPPSLAHELPELCLSVREEERKKIHRAFNGAIKNFFDKYLAQ